MTDRNILIWRDICCVNPDLGCSPHYEKDRDTGEITSATGCTCPLRKPKCHEYALASVRLRIKKRIENLKRLALIREKEN